MSGDHVEVICFSDHGQERQSITVEFKLLIPLKPMPIFHISSFSSGSSLSTAHGRIKVDKPNPGSVQISSPKV